MPAAPPFSPTASGPIVSLLFEVRGLSILVRGTRPPFGETLASLEQGLCLGLERCSLTVSDATADSSLRIRCELVCVRNASALVRNIARLSVGDASVEATTTSTRVVSRPIVLFASPPPLPPPNPPAPLSPPTTPLPPSAPARWRFAYAQGTNVVWCGERAHYLLGVAKTNCSASLLRLTAAYLNDVGQPCPLQCDEGCIIDFCDMALGEAVPDVVGGCSLVVRDATVQECDVASGAWARRPPSAPVARELNCVREPEGAYSRCGRSYVDLPLVVATPSFSRRFARNPQSTSLPSLSVDSPVLHVADCLEACHQTFGEDCVRAYLLRGGSGESDMCELYTDPGLGCNWTEHVVERAVEEWRCRPFYPSGCCGLPDYREDCGGAFCHVPRRSRRGCEGSQSCCQIQVRRSVAWYADTVCDAINASSGTRWETVADCRSRACA